MIKFKFHLFDLFFVGEPISELNTSVGKFLESNSPNISYNAINAIRLLQVASNGIDLEDIHFPITETATVQDVLNLYEKKLVRVVKMKNGLIDSIVSPTVKLVDLDSSQFEYRLDHYQRSSFNCTDPFFVCIRFVKNSPKIRLKIPMLVEINNRDSESVFHSRVVEAMGIGVQLFNQQRKFDIECDWVLHENGNRIFVKPQNSNKIPVVLINMNEPKKRSSYNFEYKS